MINLFLSIAATPNGLSHYCTDNGVLYTTIDYVVLLDDLLHRKKQMAETMIYLLDTYNVENIVITAKYNLKVKFDKKELVEYANQNTR